MMGRYGHMGFLRIARREPTSARSTRRWSASA